MCLVRVPHDVVRVEERGRHLVAAAADGDAQTFPIRLLFHRKRIRIGDHVDDGDVLASFRSRVTDTHPRRALDVAARVVAEQVVDGPHAELLVEGIGCRGAEDAIEPIA